MIRLSCERVVAREALRLVASFGDALILRVPAKSSTKSDVDCRLACV